MNNALNPRLLRHAREAKGLTQKDLADRIHVTKSAINQIESSLTTPTLANFARIIVALDLMDVPVGQLFAEDFLQHI